MGRGDIRSGLSKVGVEATQLRGEGGVDVAVGIGRIAAQDLAYRVTRPLALIDPVRRIDIVAKTVVVQELVCTADVADFGAVVIRVVGKRIDLALLGRRV